MTLYWILIGIIIVGLWLDIFLSHHIIRQGWGDEIGRLMKKVHDKYGLPGWIVVTAAWNGLIIWITSTMIWWWAPTLILMAFVVLVVIAVVLNSLTIIYRRRQEGG